MFDGRVPFPQFASIETTMKCNLQCPMCLPYLEGSTVLGSHMDPDDFEQIGSALFPYVDRFQLTVSGEPLMSKGLGRMLDLAAEYGVRAEYYTNGTLLNDRMIALILPTLGEICVSFDGATKETFEYLRAGRLVRDGDEEPYWKAKTGDDGDASASRTAVRRSRRGR